MKIRKPSAGTVLLIDDIYTTGATMDEIARTLENEGIKRIYFLALCTGKRKIKRYARKFSYAIMSTKTRQDAGMAETVKGKVTPCPRQEEIELMIRLAILEKENGREVKQIRESYKSDYIGIPMVKKRTAHKRRLSGGSGALGRMPHGLYSGRSDGRTGRSAGYRDSHRLSDRTAGYASDNRTGSGFPLPTGAWSWLWSMKKILPGCRR